MLPAAISGPLAETTPRQHPRDALMHARRHNIYVKPAPELPRDHLALRELETRNHTLCGDQCAGQQVDAIYSWPPLAEFLANTTGQPALYPMPGH